MRRARVQVSGQMARVVADGQILILHLVPAVLSLLSQHRRLPRLRWGEARNLGRVTGERRPQRRRAEADA